MKMRVTTHDLGLCLLAGNCSCLEFPCVIDANQERAVCLEGFCLLIGYSYESTPLLCPTLCSFLGCSSTFRLAEVAALNVFLTYPPSEV